MEPSSSIPPPPPNSSQSEMKVSVRTHSLLQGCLHDGPKRGGRPKVEILKRRNKRGESFAEDTTIASTGTIDSFLATDGQNDFISVLLQEFPSVIREECQRFWDAHQDGSSKTAKDAKSEEDESDGGDLEAVRQHLQQFIEFRSMYGLESATNPGRRCGSNSSNDDREDWKIAWTMMWDRYEQGKELFPPSTAETNTNKAEKKKANIKNYPRKQIPQYFFSHQWDGNPNEIILQLLPGRIDAYSASPEQHSLACQIYFYRRFNRFNPHQKATLCLDCRGSPGWTNANIFTLKSIISVCTHHLVLYHPGRTKRLVIFPVPRLALKVFEMIKSMLPPVVQKTTQLVAGSERHCDLPKMAEKGGLPLVLLERMEETRNQEASAAS